MLIREFIVISMGCRNWPPAGETALDHFYQLIFFAQENLGGAGGGGAAGATAAGGEAAARQPGCAGGPEQLLFIVLMFVLFYFMLIRPQQKRAKQHRELITSLKRGDNVITSSGIYGRIHEIDGNVIVLEIAKNTRIKVLKQYVGGIANADTETKLAETPQGV